MRVDIPKSECQLQLKDRCCCICKYRKVDYHHCITNRDIRDKLDTCICSMPKGFICDVGRIHSNWPEHGICEMFTVSESIIK